MFGAFILVMGGRFDGFKVVHDVNFGNADLRDAVQHNGVNELGQVDPSAPAGTARGGAKF